MYHYLLFLAVLIPALAGILTVFVKSRRTRNILLAEALGATLICAVAAALTGNGLAGVADMGPFAFRFGGDRLGQLFSVLFSLLFLLSGVFSLEYNEHDEKQGRFNCFYLLTLGAMMGLSYAQNLFTYYFFYECMTLLSMPLVFHDGTKESMKAALKYLGYSLFGAALVLFGFFFAGQYCDTTDFIEGGTFNALGQANLGIALAAGGNIHIHTCLNLIANPSYTGLGIHFTTSEDRSPILVQIIGVSLEDRAVVLTAHQAYEQTTVLREGYRLRLECLCAVEYTNTFLREVKAACEAVLTVSCSNRLEFCIEGKDSIALISRDIITARVVVT